MIVASALTVAGAADMALAILASTVSPAIAEEHSNASMAHTVVIPVFFPDFMMISCL
jgi:hypothetical protein